MGCIYYLVCLLDKYCSEVQIISHVFIHLIKYNIYFNKKSKATQKLQETLLYLQGLLKINLTVWVYILLDNQIENF